MNILALSGSLRHASTNTALLRAFARHAPEPVAIELFAGLNALPPFNPDIEQAAPSAVTAFAVEVGRCDGLIIAAPEYAHGIPGALKNALDWLVSRLEIPGKPVMLAHASTRSRFLREQLREVLQTMSVRLYPGPELELHLLGKQNIETLLDGPEVRLRLQTALRDFADFIAVARRETD